jgi:hypothetical protein
MTHWEAVIAAIACGALLGLNLGLAAALAIALHYLLKSPSRLAEVVRELERMRKNGWVSKQSEAQQVRFVNCTAENAPVAAEQGAAEQRKIETSVVSCCTEEKKQMREELCRLSQQLAEARGEAIPRREHELLLDIARLETIVHFAKNKESLVEDNIDEIMNGEGWVRPSSTR